MLCEDYPIMFAGIFQCLDIFSRLQFSVNLPKLIFIINETKF